jgi:hypothetical protein
MERPKTSRGKQHPSPDEFTDYVVPSPMARRRLASDYIPIHPSQQTDRESPCEVRNQIRLCSSCDRKLQRLNSLLLMRALTLVNLDAGYLHKRFEADRERPM